MLNITAIKNPNKDGSMPMISCCRCDDVPHKNICFTEPEHWMKALTNCGWRTVETSENICPTCARQLMREARKASSRANGKSVMSPAVAAQVLHFSQQCFSTRSESAAESDLSDFPLDGRRK